jgi:hypothetical protein
VGIVARGAAEHDGQYRGEQDVVAGLYGVPAFDNKVFEERPEAKSLRDEGLKTEGEREEQGAVQDAEEGGGAARAELGEAGEQPGTDDGRGAQY